MVSRKVIELEAELAETKHALKSMGQMLRRVLSQQESLVSIVETLATRESETSVYH